MELQVHIKKTIGTFRLESDLQSDNGLLSLLGASGCGKTLTLKCIAGIERPDEGRIILGSRVLFDSEKKINLPPQKRRVGYMFQDYALFPNMTVRQNILAGMGRKPDPSLADPFLERFRIAELSNRLPRELKPTKRVYYFYPKARIPRHFYDPAHEGDTDYVQAAPEKDPDAE